MVKHHPITHCLHTVFEWVLKYDSCISRWKAKFICSLCHKNGQVSEATKDLKYCSARAQHSWTNNKKVMLVYTAKRSWAMVRDLPYLKNKVSTFKL